MRRIGLSLLVVVVMLVLAVPAFAGSTTGYPNTPNNVAGTVAQKPRTKPTPAVHTNGTLPFTGIDLGLAGAAAVVLVGTGFTLRRLGRQSS